MMQIFQSCFDDRIADVLKNKDVPGKAILLFNHGLGDFVLFLPLFDALCEEFPEWYLYIGCNPERNFKYLHPKCVIMDGPYGKYSGMYDIIFNIIYPEPPRNEDELDSIKRRLSIKNIETITKPYLCNESEIGLKNFTWQPYLFPWKPKNSESNLIGVHFFGHTSVANKDADYHTAEKIWNDVKESGFKPFEIQMIPLDVLDVVENPSFIGNDTLRFEFPNLKLMVSKIIECKYFIGVDSGPIYLAGSLIGFDKVLGLQRKREFKKVLPETITILDIDESFDSHIIDWIRGQELTRPTKLSKITIE